MIVWKLASGDSKLVVVDEWLSDRGGHLSRYDCMGGRERNPQNTLSKQNFCLFLKKMHPFSQFLKQTLNLYFTMTRAYPCNLSLKIVTSITV